MLLSLRDGSIPGRGENTVTILLGLGLTHGIVKYGGFGWHSQLQYHLHDGAVKKSGLDTRMRLSLLRHFSYDRAIIIRLYQIKCFTHMHAGPDHAQQIRGNEDGETTS